MRYGHVDGIWTLSAEAVRWYPHEVRWNDAIKEPCPFYDHGRWPLLPPGMAIYQMVTNTVVADNNPDWREIRRFREQYEEAEHMARENGL